MNLFPKIASRFWIDTCCRLVQQQQFRAMNETSGKRETLFPSTRELAGKLVFAFRQPELLDTFTNSLPAILHVIHARDKIEIFFNAQILPKTEPLRHVTDFPLNCLALRNHVMTQNSTVSVVSSKQSTKHAQKRGLAAAVWAKEPVDFARGHREIDMVDRGELAEALCHSTYLDDRFAVFHLDLNSTSTGWPGCKLAEICGSKTDSIMNTS